MKQRRKPVKSKRNYWAKLLNEMPEFRRKRIEDKRQKLQREIAKKEIENA